MLDAATWGSVKTLRHVGDRVCPGKGTEQEQNIVKKTENVSDQSAKAFFV